MLNPTKDIEPNKFAEMNGVILDDDASKTQQEKEAQQEAAEPEQIITTRQTWQHPSLKFIVIGSSILLGVMFFAGMINSGINAINSPVENQVQTDSKTSKSAKKVDVSHTEQETGNIKTAMALTTQKGELNEFNQSQPKSEQPQKVTPSPVTTTVVTQERRLPPQPLPQPRTIPQSQPTIIYRSQPSIPVSKATKVVLPQSQPAPRKVITPVTPVTPSPKQSLDPMQQWIAVANVGNYGSSGTTDSIAEELPDSEGIQGGLGVVKVQKSNKPVSDSDIVPNQNINYNTKRVLIGSRAEGKLETPIAWGSRSESQVNQNYLIQLSKPLKAFDGTEVLPTGSYIVARPNNLNDSGLIQMQAVSALINVNGSTEEKNIPENSILILGENGKMLKAKSTRGSDISGSFMASVLSGVAKAAEIQNRPTSQSTINSIGVSTVTTSNDDKDLVAGFAEGSLNEMVRRMQASNQQRIQQIQSEPKAFVVESGTSVQIFVNQTVSL
ncbi:hypothetical protein H6G97_20895 [Nostoc flagelliforme FACHB-838]|uniref:Uncharacterized protein n=1 Tax=Nostoc flagelliforme FACHB-838 TaxID=2692904 RepID=A0ABR8DRQ3_9NOSO|nr:TrbI/VirB10 family protein [Nostoc flagelliforme]MBD2531908.1 hypothetical protein [Nostoc flagelliforme FACHB-838]